jgi:hypothetical protein
MEAMAKHHTCGIEIQTSPGETVHALGKRRI